MAQCDAAMIFTYFLLCCIPMAILFSITVHVVKPRDSQTTLMAAGVGVFIVVVLIAIGAAARESKMTFKEVWNGQTVSKSRDEVHCEHSYRCRCYTTCSGSGSNRTCSEHCSTCYYHSYDVDWNVKSTIGALRINRVDWQGLQEPRRWTSIVPGEPVAVSHWYTDYLRSSETSVLTYHKIADPEADKLPIYPMLVYDYYRLDRLVKVGVDLPDTKEWNTGISLLLRDLGPAKQVNVVLVITNQPAGFENRLLSKWNGANKNDAVVFIGVDDKKAIVWTKVFSLAKFDIFNVQLARNLKELRVLDRPKVLATIHANISKTYERRRMREFSYLKDDIPFPTFILVLAVLLSTLVSCGLVIFIERD